MTRQDAEVLMLRQEVERLRADAERYRWIRRRLQVRQLQNVNGEFRPGIDTRIGRTYFDSPEPFSTNPEHGEKLSAELDAAIDAAMKEQP